MRVLVLHDRLGPAPTPDELDTLAQAGEAAEALRVLGHEAVLSAFEPDIRALRELLASGFDAVANLVESVHGFQALIHLAPALLERLGVSFTGSGSRAMAVCADKLRTKQALLANALPTPAFLSLGVSGGRICCGDWLLKPVGEHGSVGLENDCLVQADSARTLRRLLAARSRASGMPYFAERYVFGREFTVSLLQEGSACRVLPVAEMLFLGYPAGKARILGYRSKWAPESEEHRSTQRRQDFGDKDSDLLGVLAALARACWRALGLSGYARVDFRVDERGRPWIVDVNANPCLAADAGFAAAAGRAGLDMADVWGRLLQAATPGRRAAPMARPFQRISNAGFFCPGDSEKFRVFPFYRAFGRGVDAGAGRGRGDDRRGRLSAWKTRQGGRQPSSPVLDSGPRTHPRHPVRGSGQAVAGGRRVLRSVAEA